MSQAVGTSVPHAGGAQAAPAASAVERAGSELPASSEQQATAAPAVAAAGTDAAPAAEATPPADAAPAAAASPARPAAVGAAAVAGGGAPGASASLLPPPSQSMQQASTSGAPERPPAAPLAPAGSSPGAQPGVPASGAPRAAPLGSGAAVAAAEPAPAAAGANTGEAEGGAASGGGGGDGGERDGRGGAAEQDQRGAAAEERRTARRKRHRAEHEAARRWDLRARLADVSADVELLTLEARSPARVFDPAPTSGGAEFIDARGAGARLRARSARRCSPRAGAACLRRYMRRAPLAAVPAQPRALAALLVGGCARCPRGWDQALAQRCRRPRTHLARVSRRARRARRWPGCSRPPRARRRSRASCPRASAGGWRTRARAAWLTWSPSTAWPCSRRCRRTRCAARARPRPPSRVPCLWALPGSAQGAAGARGRRARALPPLSQPHAPLRGASAASLVPQEAPPALASGFAGSARGLSAAARARGQFAWPFNAPVEVSKFPDYSTIVPRPMDFGTVRAARRPTAPCVCERAQCGRGPPDLREVPSAGAPRRPCPCSM
jgi:hypothetical protein